MKTSGAKLLLAHRLIELFSEDNPPTILEVVELIEEYEDDKNEVTVR